jgi:molybdopterin-binding protein
VADAYRIGEAAAALGVRPETLRRWERDGRLTVDRSAGGQRRVPATELARLLAERRSTQGPIAQTSARNHFAGIVISVTKDRAAATVELQAGPYRIVSLLTREAVDELGLKPGVHAVASVKATNVMIDLPATRGGG